MSSKKLQIVHIASEVEPFSKTGGLADVASSLPQAIAKQGHEVIVITPLYTGVISKTKYNLKQVAKDVKIELSEGVNIEADFWQGKLKNGIKIYFVENNKYFGKRKSLYGSKHENARFFFFDLAAINLIKIIKFKPDIIHCHDWHTGLIPYFIKKRF